MSAFKKARAAVITSAAVVALVATVALPAQADPSPNDRVLNGTGSDTTQDVYNGLGVTVTGNHDANGTTPVRTYIGSFDATGGGTIATPTSVSFNRPNGSGAGVTALKSSKDATTLTGGVKLDSDDLQYARTSSFAASAAWDASGNYQYIPLAVDAVTYAKHDSNTTIPANIPLGASVGEQWSAGRLKLTVKNIWGQSAGTGTITLYTAATGGSSYTVGDQNSGAAIVPFVPQGNSGTRQFWQQQVTGSTSVPFGTHVKDSFTVGTTTTSVQEHDGSVLAALPSTAVVPFSIAQHVAQSKVDADPTYYSAAYGVTVNERLNGAAIQQIDGFSPTTSGVLNPSFPVRRPVFTVVLRSEYQGATTIGGLLRTAFGPGGTVYSATNGGNNVLTDFGFGSLGTGVDFTIEGTAFTDVDPGEIRNDLRANP